MMLTDAFIKPIENKVSSFGLMSSEKINPSEWRSDLQYRLNGRGVVDKNSK